MSYAHVDDEPGYADEDSAPDWQLEEELAGLRHELSKLTREVEELRAAMSKAQEERFREAAEQGLKIEELRLENARLRSSRDAALHWRDAVQRLLQECQQDADTMRAELAEALEWRDAAPLARTNLCGETCERAKLCATCARGLETSP